MKKISIISLVLLLITCLASCATVKENFELSKDRSEIKSVDVYKIEKGYYEGDIQDLRSENTPVYSFEADNQSEFLDKLSSAEFEKKSVLFAPMDGGYDYSGYVISIVYADGSYDIVAENGQFYYCIEEDGKEKYKYDHSDYCGNESWSSFVETFIEK